MIDMSKFTKEITWRPAFDKRHKDPEKNYGIGGLQVVFALIGEHGAVSFQLMTGIYLPVESEHGLLKWEAHSPMAYDIGYHSREPLYEWHDEPSQKLCLYLDAPCYYDGSSLNADKPFHILVRDGEEKLWEYLEEYYKEIFQ